MRKPEYYTDGQGTVFCIQGVGVNINADRDNHWIYYTNIDTNQEYSCLSGAFFSRFTRLSQLGGKQ